jgi:hypothetical protein
VSSSAKPPRLLAREVPTWEVLQEVVGSGAGLTSWEVGFALGMTRQLEGGRRSTSRQRARLKRIHSDRVRFSS